MDGGIFKGGVKMLRNLIITIIALMALSTIARADQITLKNGDRLSGNIIKSDSKSLTIKTDYAGNVTVAWDLIQRIVTDQPIYVMLKNDQVMVGNLIANDGEITIKTDDSSQVKVSRDVVLGLRSKDEQLAHQASIERLRNPSLLDLWTGTADAGLSLTRGNSKTFNYNFGVNAARTTSRDKISIYANSLYARNSTSGVAITTANAIRGGLRYDMDLSKKVFLFGAGDFEHDEFQKLDLRMIFSGGLGWHVIKQENTTLNLFAGGALNKEYFFGNTQRTSAEILMGEELTHRFSDRVLWQQRCIIYPSLSEIGDFRLGFDSTITTNINKWLGWQVTLSDRFISNPAIGAQKNDVLLTTGIRFNFGRR